GGVAVRVSMLTPLPPAKTGVAHYASMLIPALAKRVDLVLNDLSVPDRIYHLGNNPHHEWIYREAMRTPGVIVLHDLVLHHLIVEMPLARGGRAQPLGRGARALVGRDDAVPRGGASVREASRGKGKARGGAGEAWVLAGSARDRALRVSDECEEGRGGAGGVRSAAVLG